MVQAVSRQGQNQVRKQSAHSKRTADSRRMLTSAQMMDFEGNENIQPNAYFESSPDGKGGDIFTN